MYKDKVKSILLVNSYLIKCKMSNPASNVTKATQRYLTHQINQTLNKRDSRFSMLIPLSLFFILK